MNISTAANRITDINKSTMYAMIGDDDYKWQVARILQELLDTKGVADEYLEVKK